MYERTENENHAFFRNRSFLSLWLASTCSFLALSTYLFAEQWYILRVLQQEAYLGIVLMLTLLPRIFLMLIGGVIADRFKKAMIMRFSSLFRLGFVIALLFVYQNDALGIVQLSLFAFLFGCIDAFFSPASSALLPLLLSSEDFTRANAVVQTSNQLALLSGPLLGGILLTAYSFTLLFVVVGCFLSVTFLCSLFISERHVEHRHSTSATAELIEGVRYVFSEPYLRTILFILIIINFFFFGPLLMGIPLLVDGVLHGQALDLSYLQGAYQIGMLLGAAFIGLGNIQSQSIRLLLLLIGGLGIGLGALGQISTVFQGVVLLLTMGLLSAVINVLLLTTIQATSQQPMMGRVMSLVNAASNGLVPLSYALISLSLYFHFTIAWILLCCGIMIVITACFFFMRSRNNR